MKNRDGTVHADPIQQSCTTFPYNGDEVVLGWSRLS